MPTKVLEVDVMSTFQDGVRVGAGARSLFNVRLTHMETRRMNQRFLPSGMEGPVEIVSQYSTGQCAKHVHIICTGI